MRRKTDLQRLDMNKLTALVHYICYKCPDPTTLGAVKLNKIVWYSDVLSYVGGGKPITGETYIKRQFGPVPKHIQKVLERLKNSGDIVVREADFHDFSKREFIATTKPDISMFAPEEISTIDHVISIISHKHTASSISMKTHDAIWELAEIGEEIPIYGVLASRLGEITEDDVKWAKQALSKTA
jgi:hypothetical protein